MSSNLNGFNQSLLGTAVPIRFADTFRLDLREDYGKPLEQRRIHGPKSDKNTILYTIIIIIISAIIFVTVVALYDVINSIITSYFSNKAYNNPKSNISRQDIIQNNINNNEYKRSSSVFALLCLISAIILIPTLIFYLEYLRK